MRRGAACTLMVLMLASIGCASDTRTYYWATSKGTFEPTEAKLKRVIETSDASGRKIAPGILAEYGYFFFDRGDMGSAVRYFEREAKEWPESEAFMKRMIERARSEGGS